MPVKVEMGQVALCVMACQQHRRGARSSGLDSWICVLASALWCVLAFALCCQQRADDLLLAMLIVAGKCHLTALCHVQLLLLNGPVLYEAVAALGTWDGSAEKLWSSRAQVRPIKDKASFHLLKSHTPGLPTESSIPRLLWADCVVHLTLTHNPPCWPEMVMK